MSQGRSDGVFLIKTPKFRRSILVEDGLPALKANAPFVRNKGAHIADLDITSIFETVLVIHETKRIDWLLSRARFGLWHLGFGVGP